MTYGQLLNRIDQAITRYVANHPGAAGRDVRPGATLRFNVPAGALGGVNVTLLIGVPAPAGTDPNGVTVQLEEPGQASVVVDPVP